MNRIFTTIATIGISLLSVEARADDTGFGTGGAEVSRNGFYVYGGGGLPIAGPIDRNGPVLRVFGGYGEFDYVRAGAPDGKVRTTSADAMAGYQIVGSSMRATVYVGANYQHNSFRNDPLNPTRGGEWGVKAQGEVYAESGNTMVLGIGSFSTARDQYLLLAKVGLRVGKRMFVGPEAQFDGSERYDQSRVGLHVTGFRIGPVGLGGSIGYLDSRRDRSGVYGALGFTTRF